MFFYYLIDYKYFKPLDSVHIFPFRIL